MLRHTKQTYPKAVAVFAALMVALLAVTTVAVTRAEASSQDKEGVAEPADLANCFAFGIDQVGRGDFDTGVEIWDDCFADDYSFEFVFFPGGPSILCPSPDCPVQDFSSSAEMRALFAAPFFEDAGYLATQHQMLNVDVTSQSGGQAEVFAYIQANHFLPDDSVDIAWNDYTIQAVKEQGRWKVQSEVITGTAFLNFQGMPVG